MKRHQTILSALLMLSYVTRRVSVSQVAGGGSIVTYTGAGDAVDFSALSDVETAR